ncbi:MAG: type II secretion system protein [Candidatus Omnitrophota bacterium]
MEKRQGFTLIELMIVVIVVGVLSGLATVSFVRIRREAEYKGALTIIQSLTAAAKNRYLSLGTYVTTTSTTDTNNIYGTKVTDVNSAFHNYTILTIAGPSFRVRMNYARGDGSGAHTANYAFSKDSVRISCVGVDCLP